MLEHRNRECKMSVIERKLERSDRMFQVECDWTQIECSNRERSNRKTNMNNSILVSSSLLIVQLKIVCIVEDSWELVSLLAQR